MNTKLDVVVLGLSITSSWGNGHATTFRSLADGLHRRGHRVRFFERNLPWYAQNRDLPAPHYAEVQLYEDLEALKDIAADAMHDADLVILGSFVPDGARVAEWILREAHGLTAFYDIDTPVTLAALAEGSCAYLSAPQIARFDLYLSFTGGPTLRELRRSYQANAHAFYCSVNPDDYFPTSHERRYDLGYMGTYSPDRQSKLKAMLIEAALDHPQGRFIVVGPQYPASIVWPPNVERRDHLPPGEHLAFYNQQRFTLNITRGDMVRAGFAPSVRLFEAAACGVPIISDNWEGLHTFFVPGVEILISESASETLNYLRCLPPEVCERMAARARRRVLAEHTGEVRAGQLEKLVEGCRPQRPAAPPFEPRRRAARLKTVITGENHVGCQEDNGS